MYRILKILMALPILSWTKDVVRHRLVKAIIKAYNKEHEKENEEYANRQTPAILKKDKPQ
jgi:phosphate starvation-inducible protein PhoH